MFNQKMNVDVENHLRANIVYRMLSVNAERYDYYTSDTHTWNDQIVGETRACSHGVGNGDGPWAGRLSGLQRSCSAAGVPCSRRGVLTGPDGLVRETGHVPDVGVDGEHHKTRDVEERPKGASQYDNSIELLVAHLLFMII